MAVDIKKLNDEYLKQTKLVEKLEQPGGIKDTIVFFEDQLNVQYANFKIKTAQRDLALSRNDKAYAATLDADIENIKKDILDLKGKIDRANNFLTKQKTLVDAKLEELIRDPEMKKKLDAILYKKYDRKKKQELQKKEQLETIKQVIDSHPNIQKLLKGIDNYTQSIKGCNTIIKKLSSKTSLTPKETDRLDKAQNDLPDFEKKRDDIRTQFVAYFSKNYPDIDSDILKSISSYENINRQIKGIEKSVLNYDKAMEQLPVSNEFKIYQQPTQQPTGPQPTGPQPTDLIVTEDKPSFWSHPIKRIKYYFNQRKLQRSAEQSAEPQAPQPTEEEFKNSLKLSKDEYNSEIVQKYLENYEKNLHEAAKQQTTDSNVR